MTENYDNNNYSGQNSNENYHKTSWMDGNSNMIKFLLVALSSFLGAFLAMALLGRMLFNNDVMSPNPFSPYQMSHQSQNVNENVDENEMFRQIDRDFEMMNSRFLVPISTPKINVVKFEENNDAYKIIIDLKQFHDDEKNVMVDVKPKMVKISGKAAMKTENAQSSFSYFQEMPLTKKVDIEDVKKEKIGNNYVITIPFED